jgi:uncharacterized protein
MSMPPGPDAAFGSRRLAERLNDWVADHERWVVAAVGLLVVVSSAIATRGELDASFRPFFAEGDKEAQVTRQFERRFGQPSGEYIAAIIENDDVLSPEFLRGLRAVDHDVSTIRHVRQVLSLATMPGVGLGGTGLPTASELIPPQLYQGSARSLPDDLVERLETDPLVKGNLLAKDGKSTLLLARVDLPLSDLEGRRPVIDRFEHVVAAGAPGGSTVRTTGVSVVEAEMADIVVHQLVLSVSGLSTVLLLVLYLHFRRVGAVLTVMAAVWLAMPVTLAIMVLAGISLTVVTSQALTMVLIVGVAQGIRMQEELYRGRERGLDMPRSARAGFARLAVPALATAATTTVGFVALRSASIAVIRDFAIAAGAGVVVVYGLQTVLVPIIQRRLAAQRHTSLRGQARVSCGILALAEKVTTRRPLAVLLVGLTALVVLAGIGIPQLQLDQRFNRELARDNPIRANQELIDEQYSGFLGPEIWLRPTDRAHVTDPSTLASLAEFARAARALPEVLRVTAVTDFLPPGAGGADAERFLAGLRRDPQLGPLVDEVVSPNMSQGAVIVRTTDMGSERAGSFVTDIEGIGRRSFGDDMRVDVVGQWWMAQRGMRNLLADMLTAVTTAAVFILVVLVVTLRSWRFFSLALIPAITPIVGAIAVMGLLGITLRIGTAMILAIALGLVVDDTIYYLHRLQVETKRGRSPVDAVHQMFARDARSGLLSSLVLITGFATMSINEVSSIRDMGIVAALTMLIAVTADLLFDPAQFLLVSRRWRGSMSAVPTPPVAEPADASL